MVIDDDCDYSYDYHSDDDYDGEDDNDEKWSMDGGSLYGNCYQSDNNDGDFDYCSFIY